MNLKKLVIVEISNQASSAQVDYKIIEDLLGNFKKMRSLKIFYLISANPATIPDFLDQVVVSLPESVSIQLNLMMI